MIKHQLTHYPSYKLKSYKEYHDDILLREENYDEQGNKHGRYYMDSGKRILECEYLNGKLNGKYKSFSYYNKETVECIYIDGMIHGTYYLYVKEGLYKTLEYINGKLHGIEKTYDPWLNKIIYSHENENGFIKLR